MTELREQLQRTLGAAFTIERELGGGGMSRVFVARETRLLRSVVVKVLSPELLAGVSAERFEREMLLAARLQHPCIVPLLTTGETHGVPYFTMPFVAGASLRSRLATQGALPVDEVVRILRDVARALDYAHSEGVVHRDIKPENVLLSGDGAVVTDFGIAKALSAAQTEARSSTLTSAGASVGTPLYMSPEQVTADPNVDHRTDIYAFGVTAYEMLAGQAPFHDRPAHEMMAAHVRDTPEPIEQQRRDTPPALAALVTQCLLKDPAQRPQRARDLLAVLEGAPTPTGDRPAPSLPRGSRTWIGFAAATVAILILGFVVLRPRTAAAGSSALAVVPFVNASGDSTQDYFADGISDELANAIGRLPGVRVAARSAAYRFRGRRDLDVREVGRVLGVGFVVQGTVFRLGDRIRVSAQLSDAARGVELWSDSYEREAKGVFSIQDEISGAITRSLQARVAPGASSGPRPGTVDAEAYDLFMRGDFQMRRRGIPQAIALFQRAIARDSNFARAHAGLASGLALAAYFAGVPAHDAEARIAAAAHRALALDSTLASAHTALAMSSMHAWRWAEAEIEHKRAIAADPLDAAAHVQFGRFLWYTRRDNEARAEWLRARELDPYSGLISAWMGLLLVESGRVPEGLAEVRRAVELDSASAVISQLSGLAYLYAGQTEPARRLARNFPLSAPWRGMTGYFAGRAGDVAGARAIAHELERQSPRAWFAESAIAYAYLGAGDTSEALDALERATDAREIWPTYNRLADPMFDPLRKSARWAALVRRVGLGGRDTSPTR